MSPKGESRDPQRASFPRVSGDEPVPMTPAAAAIAFSPRERG